MTKDYATGVYVVTTAMGDSFQAWGPDDTGDFCYLHDPVSGYAAAGVTEARPLLVIDPEHDGHVERLANELRESPGVVRAALRALVDPRPRHHYGRLVRRISVPSQMWVCGLDMKWRDEYGTVWPEIPNDVEVLSEGWSE